MKHSLDAVVVRERRIFAYGWAFDSERPIRELAMQITQADGQRVLLPVIAGKAREDVAAAFPGEKLARCSGWMAYAGWDRPASCVELVGAYEDGERFTLPVYGAVEPVSLMQRMRSFVRSFWASSEDATLLSEDEVVATLRAALNAAGGRRLCLVLDHRMGGGANHFCREWIKSRLTDIPLVALLGFDVHSMNWVLELHLATGQVLRIPCNEDLPRILTQIDIVGEVFANDTVSFPHPDKVPQWLRIWTDAGAVITIAIHDYLAICPSPFLLNEAGHYCDVPKIDECHRCMRSNPHTFPVVHPGPDMNAWRQGWGEALTISHQILCFSDSSRRLLLRAYPALDATKIAVVPHKTVPFSKDVHLPDGGPLHIGVVGAIGMHKGASVLLDLAAEAVRCNAELRITVFGTLEGLIDDRVITVTGAYQHDDLPTLIENSGANLFLLPSICPETFSYVTHELIGLDMPLACFDLGAPADRVRSYSRGRVLSLTGSEQLLGDLIRFYRDLYITTPKDAT
jgi:hypothetical protein